MKSSYMLPILFVSLVAGCGDRKESVEMGAVELDASVVESLKDKRIFFGHQSVGGNVLDGIASLNAKSGNKLSVTESREVSNNAITHAYVGKNEHPLTKLDDFEQLVQANASNIDVAYVKFCYVDINEDTDVDQLFNAYVERMTSLEQAFPDIKFVKSTAPIRVVNNSFSARVKRLLGKDMWGDKDAIKRNEFNARIRAHYAGSELFDIAGYESNMQGQPHKVGTNYGDQEALLPALTDDGGHLNARGSEYIAAEFLKFVAALK